MRDCATLRGDGEWVRVGSNGYFGERATVHIADAILSGQPSGTTSPSGGSRWCHACTVEDRVVVGDAALVMDDAHVGAGSLITAG
jgi:carbonic anhydrase/acetyltransferase-like protein (isoleucine patch superfamily)